MVSLRNSDDRFGTRLEIIEGGSGFFKGIIDEPPQGQAPSFQFNSIRRLLRVNSDNPLKPGSVIQTTTKSVFIVGTYGDSIDIFKSLRLFETTGKYTLERRIKTIEPITGLPRDNGLQDMGLIWGAYEPSPETFDRQIHASFETARFLTNREIKIEDMVDHKRVTRVDKELGIYVASLG